MTEKLLSASHQKEKTPLNFIDLTPFKYKNSASYVTELSVEV